ncbi:hypothetical protein AFEL58S_01888 [Afipia felis]
MKWSNRSIDERRRHVGGFVAVTSMMSQATDVLRRCYQGFHVGHQASCSFIVGKTGVGKSTAADDFLEEIREEYRGTLNDGHNLKLADRDDNAHTMSVIFEKPGHGLVRPVLKVEVTKSTYRNLFSDTLTAIGVKVQTRATLGEMMSIARQQIREQGIRLIIFDDCQHITESRSTRNPYEAADVFKALMKQARVQVVCMGLPHTTDFLLENAQLETLKDEELRMVPFPCDLEEDSEYINFLKALSEYLPFDHKPSLDERSVALGLHMASDGYIGTLMKYVSRAADQAIEEGAHTLTRDHLAKAYSRKTNVPIHENPFIEKNINPEGFRATKAARLERRRAEARKGRSERNSTGRKPRLKKGGA